MHAYACMRATCILFVIPYLDLLAHVYEHAYDCSAHTYMHMYMYTRALCAINIEN